MLHLRLGLAIVALGTALLALCPTSAHAQRSGQSSGGGSGAGSGSGYDDLNAKLDEIQADLDRLQRNSPGGGTGTGTGTGTSGNRFGPNPPQNSGRNAPSTAGGAGAAGGAAGAQADMMQQYQQVAQFTKDKKFDQALPIARKLVNTAERLFGKENQISLASVNMLAGIYIGMERYDDAEPLIAYTAGALERLQGRDDANTQAARQLMATLYIAQGRYNEAEPILKYSVESYERKFGKDHLNTLNRVFVVAGLYSAQGRFSDAEGYFKRVLQGRQKALGKDHRDVIQVVSALAMIQVVLGRYDEAEPLFKRAADSAERVLGKEHPETLNIVRNMATLYLAELRASDADPLFVRVHEVRRRVLGAEHADTLTSMSDVAGVHTRAKRYDEAEPLLRRIVDIRERTQGKDHPDTLLSIAELAQLYTEQKRFGEAEPLLFKAINAYERRDDPKLDPMKYLNLYRVAQLYLEQDRAAEAGPVIRRAYEGLEKLLGAEHPFTGILHCTLALPHFRQSDWTGAMDYLKGCSNVVISNTVRGAMGGGQGKTGKRKAKGDIFESVFTLQVKAARRLAAEKRSGGEGLAREMFEIAQWALSSEAAQSLSLMAARSARGDPRLAALMRERQDLVAEWEMRDQMGSAALIRNAQERSGQQEALNKARLNAINRRIAEIDERLKREFPEHASLTSLAPLSVDEVQAMLRDDEALVLFLDAREEKPTPDETFVWVVTRTGLRWTRAELDGKALGGKALADEVLAMRCGLDASAWTGPRCAEVTGSSYTAADADARNPLPFDPERAHHLYESLFGQSEGAIKGRHLLIVAGGPLSRLPFHTLVTAPPRGNVDYKTVPWLARSNAVTVLPAVSSLNALRRVARPSAASRPMIGFGNPLLDGADSGHAVRAKMAREQQRCPDDRPQATAMRGLAPASRQSNMASVAHISMQAPLPETADELCAVARDMGADVNEVRLGARATESEVKGLSASGQLSKYRILHFATHGALAGQISGSMEPGLILTPPAVASAEDDGYLSASEIAGLKLDAEWVILSACNTAAGTAEGAETLSGLTRAFMYAQARALLVSHWAVDSGAAVKLITSAVREMSQDPSAGRAEALRRAMIGVIDGAASYEAHPSYWAPFMVVGEGAR